MMTYSRQHDDMGLRKLYYAMEYEAMIGFLMLFKDSHRKRQ